MGKVDLDNDEVTYYTADTNNKVHLSAIKRLVKEYFNWGNRISVDKYGYDFDIEKMFIEFIAELPQYTFPNGIIFLVKYRNEFIGMGGFKRIDSSSCELKRVFIQEQYRGKDLGKKLLQKLLSKAGEYKYDEIRLESARFMTNAYALYSSNGFEECEIYQGAETPEQFQSITYCMKKRLI